MKASNGGKIPSADGFADGVSDLDNPIAWLDFCFIAVVHRQGSRSQRISPPSYVQPHEPFSAEMPPGSRIEAKNAAAFRVTITRFYLSFHGFLNGWTRVHLFLCSADVWPPATGNLAPCRTSKSYPMHAFSDKSESKCTDFWSSVAVMKGINIVLIFNFTDPMNFVSSHQKRHDQT